MYTNEKKAVPAVKPVEIPAAKAAAAAEKVLVAETVTPPQEKLPKVTKVAKTPKAPKAPKAAKAPNAAKAPKAKAEPAVKGSAKVTLVVEHQGRQLTPEAMVTAAQRLWTNGGRSVSEIETLDLYVKAEDAAVYCVVNGIAIGKFDL